MTKEYNIPDGYEARIEGNKVILELKESEYERIRKFLHHTFTAQYLCKDKTGKWHGEPVTNILTYLEKQKEKSQEELVYRMNGLMIEYIKEGKDDAEKEHRFKCYRLFWNALEDADFFEQKEQKPVGWSEEDERNIETLISVIWEHYAACDLVRDDYPINAEGLVNWLKSLKDRMNKTMLEVPTSKPKTENEIIDLIVI